MKSVTALLLVLCLLFGSATCVFASSGEPADALTTVVETDKGTIQGFSTDGNYGHTVYSYYGIPYAAPPVGDLRWMPAQDAEAWDGVLDCTEFADSCWQFGSDLLEVFASLPQSEDCLYLNVITPAETTDEELPVIVWFHGGGYTSGSGNELTYNGTNLPEQGCVIVSVTTRLGAFGMLCSSLLAEGSETGTSGNYMLTDMIKALEWVQSNISAFGGDPDNVTIAGESGGGGKVSALLCSSQADGLFQRAIIQSGSTAISDYAEMEAAGDELLASLGVTTVEEARALSAEEIVDACNNAAMDEVFDFADDGYYFDGTLEDIFSAAENSQVDLLIGINEGEVWNIGYEFREPLEIEATALTEQGNNVYVYLFGQVPAGWRAMGAGCVHSMDLGYMFGDYTNEAATFDGGPWGMNSMFYLEGYEEMVDPGLDENDQAVSEVMMRMWVSFAEDGDPSTDGLTWDAWDTEAENYMYIINDEDSTYGMREGYFSLWDLASGEAAED